MTEMSSLGLSDSGLHERRALSHSVCLIGVVVTPKELRLLVL
jgi:hypothetical protein